MHGQFFRSIDKQLINEEDTFLWLSREDLKTETRSKTVAEQHQALQTKYRATTVLNRETDSKRIIC